MSTQTAPLPTRETYDELEVAYDHFNAALFEGRLPGCLITLQREKGTEGYFANARFMGRETGELVDEIAMNPRYFSIRGIREVLQTLGHEMVHQWQQHFGKPGRGRYHNREWADHMEAIGLMPSDTGQPGGHRTGDHMGDYVIEGGAFAQACEALLSNSFTLSWIDRFPPERPEEEVLQALFPSREIADLVKEPVPRKGASNRAKFKCPRCGAQAWGKPSLRLLCGGEGCDAGHLVPVGEIET